MVDAAACGGAVLDEVQHRNLGRGARGHLDQAEPYDEIHLMLFADSVRSIGLAPMERWRALLARARQGGRLVAVDEQAYPTDFAVFARYNRALRRRDGRWPVPSPLSWGEVLGQSDAACRRRRQHARGFQVPDPAVVRSSLQKGNRGTGRVVSHPRPAE
jgi:hypothetical protein